MGGNSTKRQGRWRKRKAMSYLGRQVEETILSGGPLVLGHHRQP